ncbi:PREDICTED: VPS10 domain-containing receptor SorCS3-like, partial [Phaethon lepturus]|uniref:VPS10 domain-containing receptor SorCS3-like n=1 Tax=Phaethon lepturus TaxID=97097 RepID=UPI0005307CB0
ISETLIQKLNQNLVHFELKPGVQILVHAAHLTAAPLVDLTPSHSGSAMLMLLSVVFVGLAVFVIYKFKRKIPGLNIYAQMQNEKDQEMVSPVSQRESIPNVPQSELMSPEQLVDEKLEVQPIEQPQATVQNPRKGNATKVVWTEDFQKACGSPRGFKPRPGAEVFPQLLSPRAQKKSLHM